MRQFTSFEKKVIDYITSLKVLSEDIAISNIITKYCPCSFQWQDDALTVSYNENKYTVEDILNSILTIVCLFEYLESESLIYVFERTNVAGRKELLNKKENHTKIDKNIIAEEREISIGKEQKWIINGKPYVFSDKAVGFSSPLSKLDIPWDVVKLTDRYAKSVLFCTETIRHIKKQDYKDDATVQFEINRKQTWIAIGGSLIVGFIGIIGTFMTYFQNERFHEEEKFRESVPVEVVLSNKIDSLLNKTIIISGQKTKDSILQSDKQKMLPSVDYRTK